MSVEFPSRDEVKAAAIGYFQVAHRDPITGAAPPMGPRSFCGQQAVALANLLSDVLGYASAVDNDAIPGTYFDAATGVTKTKNSSSALASWAYALGLPSGTPGVFGRRGAVGARGGAATAAGTAGVSVGTGDRLTDLSGQVVVAVRAGIVLDANPALNGIVLDAVTLGAKGNLGVGVKLRWSSPPPGLASTVTLTTALTGGSDTETDVQLALRIIEHLQSPLRGGTAADHRYWAENAQDDDGRLIPIDRAFPLPGRDGTGSIDVVITQAGSGSSRDPGATVAAQVAAWVETQRPVGDGGVRIVRPYFPSDEKLSILVRVQPSTGFEYDWDDSQGTAGGTTSTGSSGTSLILSTTNPPTSLATAVSAGSKPRIQVSIPGYAIPFVARVAGYDSNTPSGKCTLTLDAALPADPGSGATVYAGGPCVLPVVAAVLAYVDGVGVSRKSGYAPTSDLWEDAVTVARIAHAAILATSEGQAVCVTSPNVGDITSPATVKPGVLIKVGSGSYTAADFQLLDPYPTHGPQLPEVAAIVVCRGGV